MMNGTGSERRTRPVRPQLPPSLRRSLWDNVDGLMLAIAAASIFVHVAFLFYLRGLDPSGLRGVPKLATRSTGERTEREAPCPRGVCLPPPPPLPPPTGTCDPSLLAAELRQHRGALGACYERALHTGAHLGGKLL